MLRPMIDRFEVNCVVRFGNRYGAVTSVRNAVATVQFLNASVPTRVSVLKLRAECGGKRFQTLEEALSAAKVAALLG